MQYWKDLPEITYEGTDKESIVELEVRGYVEPVPDDHKNEDVVILGRMGGTIYLVFGQMVEYEYIKPEESQSGEDFSRIKIEGTCVSVF